MPMLWMLIFTLSFFSLFLLSSMIYFFFIPSIPTFKKTDTSTSILYIHNKWNWMW